MAAPKSRSKVKAAAPVESGAVAEPEVNGSPANLKRIVVCAYPGTAERLVLVWTKMTDTPLVVLPVSEQSSLREILAKTLTLPDVSEDFVLVPPNCIPCSQISFEELKGPFLFVDIFGKSHYSDRLPIHLEKPLLVDALASSEQEDDELLMKEYYKKHLHRPIEGGFKFGNLVTPVYRGNPCENLVIEAFVRKKFVTASPVGFKAITHLIDQYLLG